jgi:plastocyanin
MVSTIAALLTAGGGSTPAGPGLGADAGAGFGTAAGQANTGTIKGRITVSGKAPGNPVIRMGMDPMCSGINAGKRVVDEVVVATLDGSLANAFIKLDGTFPRTSVPVEPVTIDQRGCIYGPRVVGARVGQALRVRNSDNLLHNVHSISTATNGFNVGQPMAGMQYDFRLKDEEILKVKCDVHRWMAAYVGVVSHPYFAVSSVDGSFAINGVPAGRHAISAWHERFGTLKQTADVKPGATTTVAFMFAGIEKS